MAPTVFVFWILQELLNLGSEHREENSHLYLCSGPK